ncbi:phosphatase PAP2 family protein [Hoyosella rhizosphaerae]|uniref:Glycerophosphatase n=1 Tax=Hoyosella rhizosphaerae TaxID=1755582 RepID=A0A916U032_9ACTN|nr:bifunctional phosphatase PAP2/diacylglycerol kinase family protein [Hoyosella rhizosphaerae]MBN4927227.1 phosphatase PAP2 family protein [Hoyosella rhizosphaerae]GGC52965.1 glycerophosphatase [Hoyosella rhizosphaerae]
MRRLLGLISTFDHNVMAHSATLRPSSLDTGMQFASTIANYSKPWIAISLLLSRHPGAPRRAAVRGILAVGATSLLANVAFKFSLPRPRPDHFSMPLHRRRIRMPKSSSFPSGHSAVAAAFATGVALESPALGLAIAPLAATVAYSRVHNGVHWPSDVIVGSALGVGIAFATRRWWAALPATPSISNIPGDAPALPDGNGLLIVANPESGSESDTLRDSIKELLPHAEFVDIPIGETQADTHAKLIQLIKQRNPSALGVLGGDGTVRTVAAAAALTHHPLAVFPGGTLNHFAIDIGTLDVCTTAAAVASGDSRRIDLATAIADSHTDHTFINTASLGTYPAALKVRKKWERHLGKWIPLALGMIRELAANDPLQLTLDGQHIRVRTLFIGNGTYQPAHRIPVGRSSMADGNLDIRIIRADLTLSYTRALYAVITGTLMTSPTYLRLLSPSLNIELTDPAPLALDGDPVSDVQQLTVRTEPHALTVYAPMSQG